MYYILKYDDNGFPIPDTVNIKNNSIMIIIYDNFHSEDFSPNKNNNTWKSKTSDKIYHAAEIVTDVNSIIIF
jgi:hypothetical protein